MLILEKKLEHYTGTHEAEIRLPFEERSKSRLHCFTTGRQEVGIFLPHGQPPLQDGDILQAKDGTKVKIIAEPETLLHVTCNNPLELTKVAYHLGNRHVALQIGNGWLQLLNDHVIKDMLEHLQAKVTIIQAPFHPEQGAYHNRHTHQHSHTHSHENTHGHDHASHTHNHDHSHGTTLNKDREFNYAPKIHEF